MLCFSDAIAIAKLPGHHAAKELDHHGPEERARAARGHVSNGLFSFSVYSILGTGEHNGIKSPPVTVDHSIGFHCRCSSLERSAEVL